jgi:hypothetical protein
MSSHQVASINLLLTHIHCVMTSELHTKVCSNVSHSMASSAHPAYFYSLILSRRCREAAVYGISAVSELRKLRAEARRAGRAAPPARPLGLRPRGAEGPAFDARLGKYTLPFPGDRACV